MPEEWPKSVKALAEIIGEERIKKYISYVDDHDDFIKTDITNIVNDSGAILLANHISDLCDKGKTKYPLIHPFNKKNLKGASYHLSLGSRYRDRDGIKYLTSKKNVLTIPRNGIAVVTTYEWVNIPRFLIARWNLRVQMVYRGLVWVGSLQVDPGYQGFLFCPLYNLSTEPQELVYKDELFTVDFVLTNQFQFDKSCANEELWKPPESNKFETFDFDRLDKDFQIQSAPLSDIEDMDIKIKDMQDELKSHGRHVRIFQTTTFTVLAIIITALAFLATLKSSDSSINIKFIPEDCLVYIALAIAIIALLVNICTSVRNRKNKSGKAKKT